MYFSLILVVCSSFVSSGYGELVNAKLDRNIDIASQLVKVLMKLTIENTGKSPVSTFLYALEPDTKPHLAFFGASQIHEEGKVLLKTEEVSRQQSPHKDKDLIKIHFKNPLQPGKSTVVRLEKVLTHYLVPYPSSISQSDKQLIMYHGSHYYYSPYLTKTQTTVVTLPSSSVESFTKLKPLAHSDNLITFGSYDNIAPFSVSKLTIHCENNSPFLSVSNLNRAIEVSHWGVISVEETIDITHTGATLKGPFSRYEFQRDQSGIASVKSFKTVLPASASDVYYRDEIGNISTSHLKVLEDSTEVELRPRFPLFGGWKTHYVLGYYVPTYEYLFNSGDQYVLKLRFVDHVFDDSIVDKSTVRVILPEGSKNIQLKMPYNVKRLSDELHFTYLDTVGRPVIVLQKDNLVEHHIQDFEVHYEYQKILMLQEPFLVVSALYLLFIVVIIYVRLDFSITRDPLKESKLRVSGFIEAVHHHCDNRMKIYSKFDEALSKFKHSKDLNNYQNVVKKLNNDHKTETQGINDLNTRLKQEGSDVTDKIGELQRCDKAFKDQLQQQSVLVEKLVANKVSKQQYLDSDAAIIKKKEETIEKMNAILCTL
ncbi:dolichyl-diphosphooligosaccharide--protein glycosyltransferase subunit 1 [Parasteatoda tepidariorum]|uniref:dolichyl-diphosphooligosaccharide--protein glycosyltransferase subunit 1 n=1 Tax=Parasteatoda tepidariorum TaxID=114398 RepID=UPI00077FB8E8|nr:dolichyl-diphosphooligosaccharide--protein glycosyltransferase subunit 1 isoform X1 [Parasteatoda tepidariorum]XP_042898678.1 dolichyl-diphosphooligosaccharide--protein glycosyltransferase subunit 1 isoform X2 [Parasteatoda tepidariorum]